MILELEESSLTPVNNPDESEKLFLCGICKEMYSMPKILPNCGHSFCVQCLDSAYKKKTSENEGGGERKREIECPECQIVSKLETGSVETDLRTNISIQRAIDAFNQFQTKAGKSRNCVEECAHRFLLKLVKCPHCSEEFCDGCVFRHAECLRLEINWALASLDGHVDKIQTKDRLENLKRGPDGEKTQNKTGQNLSELNSKAQKTLEEAREEVSKVNEISLLYWKIEDLAKIHKSVTEKEELAGGIVDSVEGVEKLEIKPRLHLPFRIHCLSLKGDLPGLKEIFDAPGLPAPCKRYILEHRNVDTRLHETILHEASSWGHSEIVRYLICEQNADVSVRTGKFGLWPIHSAALMDMTEIVKVFLELKPNLLESELSSFRVTALVFAALNGNLPLVEFLVNEKGAAIDRPDFSMSPLQAATMKGHLDVVKLLVGKGANLRAVHFEEGQKTVAHVAAQFNRLEIVKYLLCLDPGLSEIEDKSGNRLIHLAAINSSLEVLKFLVEDFGTGISTLNKAGHSPFLCACLEGKLDPLRFFIEQRGFDAMTPSQNCEKEFAIHCAVRKGHFDIVKYLVEIKPELLDAKNGNGETALALANKLHFGEIADFLTSKDSKMTP